jgi:serine/threonine-protein kinase HipA
MIISKPPERAFVWVWLPGLVDPVVAGVITGDASKYVFTYGQSYLRRATAIALFEPELPLVAGPHIPTFGMASCLRDGAPDAWGRRVIINRLSGEKGRALDTINLDELTFLLESGSDRIGGLDFQHSAQDYVPRETGNSTLDALAEAADLIEQGVPLPPVLATAIQHGSSIGGARPKALIDDPLKGKKYIAKFSATNDSYSVVKAEFIAMRLAKLVGLSVAEVQLTRSLGKDVLLIERFDRVWEAAQHQWSRRIMVSALTLLGLSEDIPHYASYPDLAALIRKDFNQSQQSLRELYARMVFNILVGNTDDHARNHAAFWDGRQLHLTPAYDICPQARAGQEATQAMLITEQNRFSQLQVCVVVAPYFQLSQTEAEQLICAQLAVIAGHWEAICREAQLSAVDKALFAGNQFLNPFAFYGLPDNSPICHPWR